MRQAGITVVLARQAWPYFNNVSILEDVIIQNWSEKERLIASPHSTRYIICRAERDIEYG